MTNLTYSYIANQHTEYTGSAYYPSIYVYTMVSASMKEGSWVHCVLRRGFSVGIAIGKEVFLDISNVVRAIDNNASSYGRATIP